MCAAVTHALGTFASRLQFQDVPADAWPIVRNGFTDCVATMIAGRCEPVVEMLRQVVGSTGSREATLLFGLGRASAPDAAWVNGTAAHALDFDDVALRGHPSTVIVPALLAEAEVIGATGREIVTAYVAGYETWADLVDRERGKHHDKGWHPTGIFGPVAAAAACACLRGLDAQQSMHALGIAASRAAGLMANFGTMTKPFHAGCAAQAGVLAARLAASGMTSARDSLEHPQGFLNAVSPSGDYHLAESRVGRQWQILEQGLSIKKFPICFAAHRIVDAVIDLAHTRPLPASEVTEVRVGLSVLAAKLLRNALPQTSLEAKFSAQFAVAAALISGNVGPSELTDAFVLRTDVQALMQKVRIETNEDYDRETPVQSVSDQVHVTLGAGEPLASDPVRRPRGHPDNPLREGELWRKFSDCVAAGGVGLDASALFAALQRIDDLSTVSELYRSLAVR